MMKTIETIADLEAGISDLIADAPELSPIAAATGTPPLRRNAPGFAALLEIIAGQLVSRASAAAIWMRMQDKLAPLTPDHFQSLSEADYRTAGLSGPKIRTIEALTYAVISGALDLDGLASLPDDEVREVLTRVKGIGPWTADIYLLGCLGRRDVWPAGDLALRIAVADIVGHATRPSIEEMHEIAEPWRPRRAVAARLIWAWYALQKDG